VSVAHTHTQENPTPSQNKSQQQTNNSYTIITSTPIKFHSTHYSKRRPTTQVYDIISVGHLSIDHISLPNRPTPFVILGGSAAYVSFAARLFNTRVSIISNVGDDFPAAYMWWLKQEGIDISNVISVKDAKTTRFELKYDSNLSNRAMQLKGKAPPITTDNLPNSLKARAIHLAPIAKEITYETAEKLKKHAEVLSFDPQGLVRNFSENGDVTLCSLEDKHILDLVDIYKSSLNEIEAVTNESNLNSAIKTIHDYGVKTVIVTLGTKGSTLSVEGNTYNIPAYKPEKTVDPTGAGDAFIGGFLAEYINNANYLRCACVGSAVASLVIEAPGLTFSGDKEEIYRRARAVYEKEIKG
jgi:sugar/nucleoside kinase (ribokinase family)